MTPQLENLTRGDKIHSFGNAVDEFAHDINAALLENGMPEEKLDVGDLVRDLVVSINHQARAKPHPLLYANLTLNLAFILTIVFGAGILFQRVNNLETWQAKTQNVDALKAELTAKVDSTQEEVKRLRDRLDRLLDQPPASRTR